MLRIPVPEEVNKCSELIYISGPHLFTYLFCEKEAGLKELLSLFCRVAGTTFSRETIVAYEEEGSLQGLIIAHPVSKLSRFLPKELRCIIKFRGGIIKSFFHIIKVVSHCMLATSYPPLKKEEYFISNLAVFKEYRGRGIAEKLLQHAEKTAVENGFRFLSLYVETDNERAIRVYEKYGFHEEKRTLFPARYNKHGLSGFSKMVKSLP